jgi:hypothetical protein
VGVRATFDGEALYFSAPARIGAVSRNFHEA